MKRLFLLITFNAMFCNLATAQETESTEFQPAIRGAVMMANSHVPGGTSGGKHTTIIPTWGFDFDYIPYPRWFLTLQGDVKLESYEVEDDQTVYHRSNPFSLAMVVHYKVMHNWSFYTGPGYEFESGKDLFIMKLGTEYSFEISENFEIGINLIYENKQQVYDGWTFGIAFNKLLWKKY